MCGTYNTKNNVCSNTDVTTGKTSCSDFDEYEKECIEFSSVSCFHENHKC